MRGRFRQFYMRMALALVWVLLIIGLQPRSALALDHAWRGEYFNNPNLLGDPVMVRSDPEVNFDWGTGAPDPRIAADNFSVRWTRVLSLEGGNYRFYSRTDDGVRLFVSGRLLIDRWQAMSATTYSADVYLSPGQHAVRMEYFERTGLAEARLWWERIEPRAAQDTWRGEYFANRTLSGSPAMVRQDGAINFNWGTGSPDPRIPADNFSVRWTRDIWFEPGRYEFTATVDDGVRIYLDGRIILDRWQDAASATYRVSADISRGLHTLRVEYYERFGSANIALSWDGPLGPERQAGNLITCMRPQNSWIKVYRLLPDRTWQNLRPEGWGPISPDGRIKIDGLPVTPATPESYQLYRVEMWADGSLVRSVGNITAGQAEFRFYAGQDNYTPWACPVR
jgi:hypothetical protein